MNPGSLCAALLYSKLLGYSSFLCCVSLDREWKIQLNHKEKGNYADRKSLVIHIFHLNVLIHPELYMTRLFIKKKLADDKIRFPSSTEIPFWESATSVVGQINAWISY